LKTLDRGHGNLDIKHEFLRREHLEILQRLPLFLDRIERGVE
jgi:hypothetical protein